VPTRRYFAKPGHTPEIFAGTEIVEFSPTADFAKTLEVVSKNMEATRSSLGNTQG
jgi:hypothetical protein